MEFLEKDLEEIIFNANISDLHERGLYVDGIKKRQLRIGNYGIADMVTLERPHYNPYLNATLKGTITIYEFKKDSINISAFLQAIRYLKGIRRYLKKRNIEDNYNYKITLVGRSIDLSSSFVYLTDLISSYDLQVRLEEESVFKLSIYTYSYDIDGLNFDEVSDYKLTHEGF
jgi:hypothetical protein